MKKMQKILCMLLALTMLLSFAACAAKEAAPSTTDPRCGCGRCKDGNQSRGHPGRAAGSGAA